MKRLTFFLCQANNLSLRKKILIFALICNLLLIIAIYLGSNLIVMKKIADMENSQVVNLINRTQKIIQNQVSTLNTTTRDYAVWDDTYAYVNQQNDTYILSNYKSDTFSSYNIDLVYIADKTGESLFTQTTGQLDPTTAQEIISDINGLYKGIPLSGLYLTTANQIILISLQPINDSANLRDDNGFLLMGRVMTNDLKQQIDDLVGKTVVWLPDIPNQQSDLTIEDHTTITIINRLPTINAKQIPISVYLPREMRLGLVETKNYIFGLLALMGIVISYITVKFFENLTIKPLSIILNDLTEINSLSKVAPQVHIPRGDEYGRLAIAINKMLYRLKKSHEQVVNFKLQLAKPDQQPELDPQFEKVNLESILQQTVSTAQDQLKAKNITPSIQTAPEPILILADKNFLSHVLENIFQSLSIQAESSSKITISCNLADNKALLILSYHGQPPKVEELATKLLNRINTITRTQSQSPLAHTITLIFHRFPDA